MLMHVTAHGGCAETVRETALEVNAGEKLTPGEKSLAAPGTRTRVSITLGFFSRTLCRVSPVCPKSRVTSRKNPTRWPAARCRKYSAGSK